MNTHSPRAREQELEARLGRLEDQHAQLQQQIENHPLLRAAQVSAPADSVAAERGAPTDSAWVNALEIGAFVVGTVFGFWMLGEQEFPWIARLVLAPLGGAVCYVLALMRVTI